MAIDLEALREHVGPGPSDDVLEAFLASALEDLDNKYGPLGAAVREYLRPFGQWVKLGRRAESVESVLEGGTTVDAADFEIWPDTGGRYLRRLSSLSPRAWTGWVEVAYTPQSEEAGRDRITVALVQLDLNAPVGLAGITVGPWSEQYAGADSYFEDREQILNSLRPGSAGTW